MAVVFRPHRHLLAESMSEMKIFTTEEEMISYVKSSMEYFYHNVTVRVDEEEIDDMRIAWKHSRYVCITCDELKNFACIGMCDLKSFANCSEEEIYKYLLCKGLS